MEERRISEWLARLDSMQPKRSEMNLLIMDYLVHEGFKEAAERFKEEAGIAMSTIAQEDCPPFTETPDMLSNRVLIREAVESGDILHSESLINKFYPELLDNHRDLYFKLQQQHLIELIRAQKIDQVLRFVNENLSVETDELRLGELEKTLSLLAFDNPDTCPYSDLLHPAHRQQLASEINEIILKEQTGCADTRKPRLVTLLKLLLWTQNELEKRHIHFPKMTDLVAAKIIEPQ